MKTIILAIIMGLLVNSLEAQKLTSKESRILKIIEENHGESLMFLEKVVNMNSGTMNHDGVKKTGDVFGTEFRKIGMETRWMDMPKEMQRAGHLFAENKGTRGKKLLLIGHLDTVFEEDSPFQKYEKKGDKALGPGTNDMKGGNVVILYALKALYEAGELNNTQIIVAFHGDEEETGKPLDVSRKAIIDAAKRSEIALGFEPSTGFNEATITRRGSSGWTLKVEGKRAHSAGIFGKNTGAGAIFETSRILSDFYEALSTEKYLTFNPGVILGGTDVDFDKPNGKGTAFGKTNVVAQTVVVNGGLRFISEEQRDNARKKMREIVAMNLPKTSATIEFVNSYPAMPPTEGNKKVLEELSNVSIALGHGAVKAYDPMKRGAADISFVADYIDGGVDGLGTMGGGSHTPNEYVNLSTINDQIKRAALLIYRLTR